MKSKLRSLFPAAGAAILATLTMTALSRAADQTWNPDGPNDYWSTLTGDENWDAGVAWTQDNSAIFGGTGETVYLGEDVSATNLTFGSAGYTLTGGDFKLTLAAGSTVQADADAILNTTLAGNGITKTGTGTLTLGGNNTFSGGITVRGGTLKLGNAGALGTNGTVGVNTVTLGLTGDTNPTLDVNGQSFYMTGLAVGDTGATIRTNAWGGPYVSGETTLNGALTIYRYGNNIHEGFQNGGKITGNGAGSGNVSLIFNREGSNNFYWQANNLLANDFLGNIRVSGGELRVQGNTTSAVNMTVPDTAMLIIDAGASFRYNNYGANVTETLDGLAGGGTIWKNLPNYTLTINANNADNEGDRVFTGNISGMTGTLTLGGIGTQEFSGSTPNFTNSTTVNNGTLKLTNTNNWGSAVYFGASNSPKLVLNAPLVTDAWNFTKQISGDNAAATVEKTGTGSVTLTSPQKYKGATAVSGGKLLVSSGTLLPVDFPTIPGMKVWLDAADPEADGDATLPTDGSEVSTWKNKGTDGVTSDFTATTTGTGNPLYKASEAAFNGKPVVNFAPARKMLANTVNYTSTVSVVYVGRIGATKQRLVSGGTVNWLLGYWNGNMNTNYWNGGSLGSAADTNPHIWITGATNGSYAGYRFDAGGEVSIGTGSGAGPTAGLTLGGRWSDAERSDGDIAELFVFDHQLTTTERQALEGYLYKKYYGSQFGIVGLDAASPVSVGAAGTFGGNGGAGNITVDNGGTLQGGMDNGTGALTAGSLTLNGTATLKGSVSATAGTKAISVTDFTVNGGAQSVLLAATGTGLTDGTSYDFLTWSGTTNVTDASVFKQVVRNLTPTLDLANKKVQLTYSAAGSSIYWTGGSSAWNDSATNWKQTSDNSVTTFMISDAVLFHDTTGSATVDISDADVSPASVTFDNTAAGTSYIINGSKGIVSGSITKNNDGVVTINNVNPTSGAVALNGGTVAVAQNGGLGTGAMTFDGGARLQYTGGSSASNRSVAINNAIGGGGGSVEVTEAATVLSGGALSGAGSLTKSGAGALGFSGDGTYTGALTVSGGTLVANHANAFGTGTATLVMGDANTGANPVEFKIDGAVTGAVKLASVTNSNFGTSQTITLNTSGSLGQNGAGLITTLNLNGSVPVTLKGTNTGSNHITPQDVNWRIEGAGIPAGSTALILDGSTYSVRTSQLSDTSAASNFTGDVLIKGNVTTQGRTYLAGGGTVAENQNLNFLNNDVTVDTGAEWKIVWGGETMGALNGAGQVTLNNQSALDNIGLTLGNTDRPGSFSGKITGGFGVRKKGSGIQILSGTGSNYSGPTLIESGTLQVDGTKTGGGTVTVKPYATLSGSGTVSGTTTVEGFGAIVPAGASTIGEMALGGLILAGTYQCDLDDTTADVIRVSGTLTVNAGATIQFTGTPVADSYTIATYTTLGGALPAIAAPAGYVVAVDPAFNEIVLRKATGYDTWATANAPGQTMDQDHDNDGVDNGIEYFMGETGNGFTANPAPDANHVVTWTMGNGYAGVYGTDYHLEISDDLEVWNQVPQAGVSIDPGVSVSYTLPTPGTRKFARLVVTGP
ncbi:MAG: autotransporter-associated beta strand repeat-containing protein [Verrucomicrobia bacterium]|nr:autotransporter-associated beta strand repeat-containing protein [Verrucomicrobiota bacterium]